MNIGLVDYVDYCFVMLREETFQGQLISSGTETLITEVNKAIYHSRRQLVVLKRPDENWLGFLIVDWSQIIG